MRRHVAAVAAATRPSQPAANQCRSRRTTQRRSNVDGVVVDDVVDEDVDMDVVTVVVGVCAADAVRVVANRVLRNVGFVDAIGDHRNEWTLLGTWCAMRSNVHRKWVGA